MGRLFNDEFGFWLSGKKKWMCENVHLGFTQLDDDSSYHLWEYLDRETSLSDEKCKKAFVDKFKIC